jgi:hypothetical protein
VNQTARKRLRQVKRSSGVLDAVLEEPSDDWTVEEVKAVWPSSALAVN